MLLQIWRYLALMLAALLMGTTLCHVLEMPAKMRYPAALYLNVHRTLYVAFGPPNVGPAIEIGAIVSAAVLVFLLRRRPGFGSALVGEVCLLAGLLTYFAIVEPANAALGAMSPDSPPGDWTVWRDQWEAGHAMRFGLHFLGVSALILAVLPSTRALRAPPPVTRQQERPASMPRPR